ncbi:MAG: nitrate reductase molybdenum cofactor assembly chaperone, partial [Buttiauxella gaviniae]
MIELLVISRLLEYPDTALWQHQQELRDALAEGGALNLQQAAQLNNFISTLCGGDLLDAQANYSELF